MIVEQNKHMITYRLEKYEAVDKTAYEMLNKGVPPGFFILGRNGAEIKVPVAGSKPLDVYLYENPGLETVARIIREAITTIDSMGNYFLEESTPLLSMSFAYVKEEKLKLICIPASHAAAIPKSEQDFLREIIASGKYSEDEYINVYKLLTIVNGLETGGFLSERVLIKLEELFPPKRIDNNITEVEEEKKEKSAVLDSKEAYIDLEIPKKSFLEKVKSFFFVDERSYLYGDDGEFEKRMRESMDVDREELPQGINLIVVRETGAEYPLCFGPDYIGTDENQCSICFPNDRRLGERHCTIRFERGKYVIEDLGCETGTLVNGNKLAPHKPRALQSADLILVGAHQLIFSHRPA